MAVKTAISLGADGSRCAPCCFRDAETSAHMDHYSILDHDSSASTEASAGPPNGDAHQPGNSGSRSRTSRTGSTSSRGAAANALDTNPGRETFSELCSESSSYAGLHFPGDDGGRSLAAMAERDLDAALQLLAERAQYITGASGAAIALRRGAVNDMLCRASAGSNAPELGALLSAEHGLSGESVRTRRPLRCDDAERDPRVNREGCRQLGIASVVIMPIVGDGEVIGVFELFSGKPGAFNERDLSALERLGGMVETAVKHAVASQTRAAVEETLEVEVKPPEETIESKKAASSASSAPMSAPAGDTAVQLRNKDDKKKDDKKNDADTNRPLFWSAVLRADSANRSASQTKPPLVVPPVLRQLQKCQTCGFPVSPGRIFCVECEEKQWRSECLSQPEATPE